MSALRFKVGEIALLYSSATGEPYKPPSGTEVMVRAVGPFPAGHWQQLDGRMLHWRQAGDYIIDAPAAYGMCLDSELRKLRPPIPDDVLETFKTKDQGVPA